MDKRKHTPARVVTAYIILLAFASILLLVVAGCKDKAKAQITAGTVNKGAML